MERIEEIQNFNQELISDGIDIELNKYFETFHDIFDAKTEIECMEYFLEICGRIDFCIHHRKLKEYGVITNSSIWYAKQCVEDKDVFIEGIDYIIKIEPTEDEMGRVYDRENLYMTQSTFKTCLQRSKNERKYARYFQLFEEIYKFYNHYRMGFIEAQLKKKEEIIKDKTKTIKIKQTEIKSRDVVIVNQGDLIQEMKQLMIQNNIKLDRLDHKNDILLEKVEDIKIVTHEIASRSVPNPVKKSDTHSIALFQNKKNKKSLVLIRGTKQHISNKEVELEDSHKMLLNRYNANPINFFIRLKDEIKKHNNKVKRKIEKGILVEDDNEVLDTINFHYTTITLGKDCSIKIFEKIFKESINEKYTEYNSIQK